jgi:hypothetical protein
VLLEIRNVQPVGAFVLRLEFTDGKTREVDLRDELYGEVFEPLRNASVFSQVTVNPETGTIEWPNGADFSPEFFARIGGEVERVA